MVPEGFILGTMFPLMAELLSNGIFIRNYNLFSLVHKWFMQLKKAYAVNYNGETNAEHSKFVQ